MRCKKKIRKFPPRQGRTGNFRGISGNDPGFSGEFPGKFRGHFGGKVRGDSGTDAGSGARGRTRRVAGGATAR